jgi:hypothetical protein
MSCARADAAIARTRANEASPRAWSVARQDRDHDVIVILACRVADGGLDTCKLSSPDGANGVFAAESG